MLNFALWRDKEYKMLKGGLKKQLLYIFCAY